ncbi:MULTISPECIES: heparinase II/III family protein [unclassified Duganella]|uniref:heparinase II/III domain-containing protein n=1 Tax=unclassified Duganella TaxID=2636909 RepID=UPI000E341AC9|nr:MULTISPECIES: heparinase II/III family protein [unclassified Duganella]RFP09617.1 DUF4962 domain-containing protein [Duganella sp. BJB475]RFP27737.1 DUF4962 domain-containing protein [Duganella sp. BJB476]
MMVNKHVVSAGVALAFSLVAGASRADWAESTDMSIVRPAPTDAQSQVQNPPAFAWARYPTGIKPASYTLEVSSGGKVYATFTAYRNFYLPSVTFPAGQYTWRVKPSTKEDWSTPRAFSVVAGTGAFVVPENKDLEATILGRNRPRQLPSSFLIYDKWPAAMKTARGPAYTRLVAQVTGQIGTMKSVSDALWPVTATTPSASRAAYVTDINKAIGNTVVQVEAAALLHRLNSNPDKPKETVFLNEALARGDEIAALDPNGMTSYVNQDNATRSIILALAKAADYLGPDLDAARKTRWMNSISARTAAIYADLAGSNSRLDEQPYDAHGVVALGYLAVVSTLTLGDIPAAKDWFEFAFRAYVNSIYVWSGPEGGYSNGTAYAMYSTDYALKLWQPLIAATYIDLFKKPWSTGFAQYLMHFLPPGAPGHVFGDEREYPIYSWVLKGFVSRLGTPNAAWYVKNLIGDEGDLALLEAQYPLPVETVTATPVPPANAAVYRSIGWVAMHSDLANRARTSVYFKSSPYGSYNHSHGDQNSLVIDSGGRRLLTEAGYEDFYYSPLVQSWYRQTKAHNAITFNNGATSGVGQLTDGNFDNLMRKGKITAFSTTPAVDYAEGDATQAYGTALTSAVRKVWYLRTQDVVVVVDKLAAPTALTFEWNMHAFAAITPVTPTSVKITNVDRSLCASTISTDPSSYQKRTGPVTPGRTEDHGAFVKTAAAKTAEFVVVLDVGCKGVTSKFNSVGGSRTLDVTSALGTQTITLGN